MKDTVGSWIGFLATTATLVASLQAWVTIAAGIITILYTLHKWHKDIKDD